GRIDDAIEQYSQAIRLGGDPLPQVYFLRGRLFRQQGRLDRAIVDFLSAIDHKPDMAEAYLELAGVYAQRGHMPEARQAYQRAVELDPSLRQSPSPAAH